VATAAARSLYKLMAYKDEYEVARLYADPAFLDGVKASFGEGAQLRLNLAPPLFSKKDPQTGVPRKREFGPWVLKLMPLLAKLRPLRGTALDIFGYTEERRMERQLRDDYFGVLKELEAAAGRAPIEALLELAALPQTVRGFGHVKAKSAAAYEVKLAALRASLSGPAPAALAGAPS
jgi:indolepyruvate ferredoxin oxidoreductase